MSLLKIAVIGLGYVGLPLAVALARSASCVGFDINPKRISELKAGQDSTREVDAETLKSVNLVVSDDINVIRGFDIYIVTVPTPVDGANNPDLGPVLSASRMIAGLLEADKGQIVVYESTVYPGVTEDICGPALEKTSGLVCGKDFFLGYSPERINPGDKEHTVDRITKVVAGQTPDVLTVLAQMYGKITTGGVFPAKSIKIAEAAKVIENAQRDINIAFMNEIALIFQKIGISVYDVLDAAATKWNFLKFSPGLVGGHCIGVDPYYLSHLAQQLGHQPHVILAGRQINDSMGAAIADSIHTMLKKPSTVLILGLTFKEDVPDLRNSKVIDVITRLKWIGHDVTVHDPLAYPNEAAEENGLTLDADAFSRCYDAVIGAVPHHAYRMMTADDICKLLNPNGVAADIKGMWRAVDLPDGVRRWQM
jgi:UDP-N-acetyl-D-glucosamine/UDP-N-acetyl-D-galactosamine dehydrogenase